MPTLVNITVNIPEPWWDPGAKWKAIFGTGIPIGTPTALTEFTFASDNPLVTIGDNGKDLHVKGDVTIRFVFPQMAGDLPAFYPIGIGFYRENAGSNAMKERRSLPIEDIKLGVTGDVNKSPYVELHDTDEEKDSQDGATKVQWKYYLLVQDNFGRLGVIDPDIENDYEQ